MVEIKGHQYIVQLGEILKVDKLPLGVGDEFTFDKVLLLRHGEKMEFGRPYLDNIKVTAEVLQNSKGKKIRIFKYRAKKHYRLTKGHRSKYTDIHITGIDGVTVPSQVNFDDLVVAAHELVKA